MKILIIVYIISPILVLSTAYSFWKAQRDYKIKGKLSVNTACFAYTSYILHAFLTAFASWQSFWLLPISKTLSVIIGIILILFGLGLYIPGKIEFRSFKRASGLIADKLITSGIYRFSRNPMLVGWCLILLGIALIGRSLFALILVVLYWLMLRPILIVEEEYLEQVFGEEYREYHSRTSRYLGWPKSK